MTELALIGDIGGTNARFAVTDLAAATPSFSHEQTLSDADFDSLYAAAEHYLEVTQVHPKRATLSVASPIEGDTITLTNRGWSFKQSELRRRLGLEHLQVINDFAAIAWAAPHLTPTDRIALHGVLQTPIVGPVTLIGAGTGLGVALLTGSPADGWRVIPTEGGHASFAPVDAEDRRIAAWLATRYGRISNERALSGNGLACIDAALRGVTPVPTPAVQPGLRAAKDVVAAALGGGGGDTDAQRALARFCRIYGVAAGDAALLHGAATVLVTGGVVLHFLDFFRASGFMDAFVNKGRYRAYMQHIAVQVITNLNPGLLGAAAAAHAQR